MLAVRSSCARAADQTQAELIRIGSRISRRYFHETWQGQLLNEFYADYCRERGIDATLKDRLDKE
jgi:hypothetical protein